MLIIMMLLSSPVFLTIPEGSWLSSDYIMTEEWTLDPFEFVSTERVHIGCITESESSEYNWDITLLDKNRVIKFEDDQQVDQLGFDITVCQQVNYSFSPGGNYLLLFDKRDGNCLRIDLEEMQTERISRFDNYEPETGYFKISDSGSIFPASATRRIFNTDLELVFEDSGYRSFNERWSRDHEGNRYFFTKYNQLIAVNGSGQEKWRTEIGLSGGMHDTVTGLVTNSLGNSVALLRNSLLQLFSGDTGTSLYSESFDYIVANPLFSSSGNLLAVETQTYEEIANYTSGIRLYSINSPTNEVSVKYHSIYPNRYGLRFAAASVLDNGMVLAILVNVSNGLYRLVLLDSSGNAVWITAPVGHPRGFTPSCGRNGGMTHDGSGIWYFDGSLVHSYHIERR